MLFVAPLLLLLFGCAVFFGHGGEETPEIIVLIYLFYKFKKLLKKTHVVAALITA